MTAYYATHVAHDKPITSGAIVGSGAMGAIIGRALVEAGVDTTFIDVMPELVAHLNDQGLLVERGSVKTKLSVRATTDPATLGVVDVVIFMVKGYQTDSAARLASPLVDANTTVVTLQNGWGHGDVLSAHFDPRQLVAGITYHSGTVRGRGHIAHTNVTDAPTYVGPLADADLVGAERVADALRAGGLHAQAIRGIRTEIWKKVVLSAAVLAPSALTRLTDGGLLAEGELGELTTALTREAVAVGRAAGFDVDAEESIDSLVGILSGSGSGRPSMLQDLEAQRRTEIDAINGAVARLGAQHGVETPLNSAMVGLVQGCEAAHSYHTA
jgi:2-dehydropantoate 2-reductase